MSFDEAQLRADLRPVASEYPVWGWRKARWHLLATERWKDTVLNSKRVRRLLREEGLVCKPKRRKKRRTSQFKTHGEEMLAVKLLLVWLDLKTPAIQGKGL